MKLTRLKIEDNTSDDKFIAKKLGLTIKEIQAFRKYSLFNEKYYLKFNDDVQKAGIDPFKHYVLHGSEEGRNPSRFFSTQHYVNSKIYKGSTENPLAHFYKHQVKMAKQLGKESWLDVIKILGSRANRFVCDITGIKKKEIDEIVQSGLFDFEYYESNYPDVAQGQLDSIIHYFCYGDSEGRASSTRFNASVHRDRYGLSKNDLAIIHYLRNTTLDTVSQTVEEESAPQLPTHNQAERDAINIYNNWITPVPLHINYRKGSRKYLMEIKPADSSDVKVSLTKNSPLIIPFIAPSENISDVKIPLINSSPLSEDDIKVEVLTSTIERNVHESTDIKVDMSESLLAFDLGNRWYKKGRRYYIEISLIKDSEVTVDFDAIPFSDEHAYTTSYTYICPDSQFALPDSNLLKITDKYKVLIVGECEDDCNVIKAHPEFKALDCEADIFEFSLNNKYLLHLLAQYHVVIFDRPYNLSKSGSTLLLSELVINLNFNGTTTVFIDWEDDSAKSYTNPEKKRLLNCFHYGFLYLETDTRRISNIASYKFTETTENIDELIQHNKASQLPHVAIVSVLYKKADIVANFIDVVIRQTYFGPITLLLVDDCSPDNSVEVLGKIIEEKQNSLPENLTIKLLVNDENLGNCASRNRGLYNVNADIFTIVDCDCLLNYNFLTSHVRQHLIDPTDVVIGPLNLETNGEDAWGLLNKLENNPELVKQRMNMQDDIQLDGFVNCITRNFSIKKEWLENNSGFDTDFSYSAKKDTGFGWEDVEFGSRIYKSGAYIKYTENAISLHQSHPTSVPEERQIIGSAKNFNLLFERHPDIKFAARRWATDTSQKILKWAEDKTVEHDNLVKLRRNFAKPSRDIGVFLQTWRTGKKRLKILQYRWHVPHQYEIHKLPHDFTLVTGTGTGFTDHWSFDQRQMRDNVRMLPKESIKPEDYDVAILHFDENVLCSDLSNGVLGPDWGRSFKWFLQHLDGLPKIAVCHGTPPFVGQYSANDEYIEKFEIYDEERVRLIDLLRNVEVVCNSHQASIEWGFLRSRVIWHGLDPQEIPPGENDPAFDIVTHGIDNYRPHYRGAHYAKQILSTLEKEGVKWHSHQHEGARLIHSDSIDYASASFRAWIDHLRNHKIYLNTTLRSPMPRSRTEAMIAGCIPVCINNHDVDCFIRNEINGFYSESTDELTDFVRYILRNDSVRREMSRKTRLMAMDMFNHDRFLSDWTKLLNDICGTS